MMSLLEKLREKILAIKKIKLSSAEQRTSKWTWKIQLCVALCYILIYTYLYMLLRTISNCTYVVQVYNS